MTSVLRVLFNKWVAWLMRRKGDEAIENLLPFPVWELQVFLITFTGVAEAAGEAIISGCLLYEIVGGLSLLMVSCFTAIFFIVIAMACRNKILIWEHIRIKEAWADARERWKEHKDGKSFVHKLSACYEACLMLDQVRSPLLCASAMLLFAPGL